MSVCPLCTNDRSTDFPIRYTFHRKDFQAQQCTACLFVYLDPRPTDQELALLYSDEYFLHDGTDCGAHSATDYETAAVKGSVKFPEILRAIQKFRPSGDFFEIGCGMGYFLDYARQKGYHVSGIEYAAMGTKICRERFGLDVRQGSFEEFPLQPGRYDVIFMGDVLEHLIDPRSMLEKARQMLKPSGIVAIEVPSMFNSIVGRLAVVGYRTMRTHKQMPMPPYHVNEFTPVTLRAMLLRAGFEQAVILQRIKSPGSITLRGNMFEKAVKKALHYPNYLITKSFGVLGDRLLGIGRT
ncbi:MAG: class I SAM-dependent methyltransferase [Ignavibacteriales bacterium]|nr:class I SAM-dependent methyltransferase [Ignavibacteriales bacterium]